MHIDKMKVEGKRYFNVRMEFNKDIFHAMVENAVYTNKTGYVCCIESNNLTVANSDPLFNQVVNHALVNSCDGSVVAKILSYLYKQPFDSYVGADVFMHYISLCKYRHFFLGNTSEVLSGLREKLSDIDSEIGNMRFETLPFKAVDDFDYVSIAEKINQDNPDMIWISLGAPKQELFMSRLQPYLKRGVMFGVGAAFNFYSGVGKVKRAPSWMRKCRLEWLHRALEEPGKNVPRYLNFIRILPRLIRKERRSGYRQN